MRYSIFAMVVFFIFTLSLQGEENSFMMPKNPVVVVETNLGNITIALKPDVAPKAVENFLQLAKKDYYNDVIFHRVIKDFMIQGGDPTGTGRGGESVYGKPFEDEVTPAVQFNKPGLLAMANSGPKTNGSQFFITTASTPWLNGKHTIFGEVIEGYDVVKKIENTPKNAQDKPLTPVKIIKITLVQDGSNAKKAPSLSTQAE
jgi:peptidylprolyl isomerase